MDGSSGDAPSSSKKYPSLLSRPHSSDACATIVQGLMQFNQSTDEEFSRKACESLVKKMKDKRDELDALIISVYSKGDDAKKCITIARTLDGRLQVAGRKGFPHVVYAKIFRWPDLHKNELKHLPLCENAFDLKGDNVCVNPYHYERILNTGMQMDLKMDDDDDIHVIETQRPFVSPIRQHPQMPQHRPNVPPSHMLQHPGRGVLPPQMQQNQYANRLLNFNNQMAAAHQHPLLRQQPQQSPQPGRPMMPGHPFSQGPAPGHPVFSPHLAHAALQGALSGAQMLTSPVPTPLQHVAQSPLHPAQAGPSQLTPQPTPQMAPPGSVPPPSVQAPGSHHMKENGSDAGTPGEQREKKRLNADQAKTLFQNMTNQNMNTVRVTTKCEPPDSSEFVTWAQFVYYEKTEHVADKQAKRNRMFVDGGFSTNAARFSLGNANSLTRDELTEKIRASIGQGVRLSYKENGDVWMEVYTHYPVFVQSQFLNRISSENHTVDRIHKVYPGGLIKVFDLDMARTQIFQYFMRKILEMEPGFHLQPAGPALMQVYNQPSQLNHYYQSYMEGKPLPIPDHPPIGQYEIKTEADLFARFCVVRLSFVKGWGADYTNRPIIHDCPCWVELKMNKAYEFLDAMAIEDETVRTTYSARRMQLEQMQMQRMQHMQIAPASSSSSTPAAQIEATSPDGYVYPNAPSGTPSVYNSPQGQQPFSSPQQMAGHQMSFTPVPQQMQASPSSHQSHQSPTMAQPNFGFGMQSPQQKVGDAVPQS